MAPEKVLTLPLSGEEIRKAILDRISQRLEKDGYLNTNLAYDYYECKITIDAVCHDVGRAAPVKVTETVTLGEKPDGELDQHGGEFEIEPQPPNTERVETGQEVPVLTHGKDGKAEVKGIRYGRTKTKAKV
jgi:hypothetical protein